MTDPTQTPGAVPTGELTPTQTTATVQQSTGTGAPDAGIDPKTKAEILQDLTKWKSKARETEAELARLKSQAEEQKMAELRAKEQWKTIAEQREIEAKSAREQAERIQSSYINEKKYSAVRDAVGRLGLRPEAVADLDLVALDDVVIETTSTGKLNVLGAESFAERLKASRPHWFAAPSAPNVNTNGVRVLEPNGPVTPSMIIEAEKAGKKSGDMTQYRDLMKRYRAQGAR